MALTFEALRKANVARLPEFKNARGGIAHSQPDGSDWTLLEWAGALDGEVGELCNLFKKIRRGGLDFAQANVRMQIAKEIADVQIYLDLLAFRAGVSLELATISKFNETSRKVASTVRLTLEGLAVRSYVDSDFNFDQPL